MLWFGLDYFLSLLQSFVQVLGDGIEEVHGVQVVLWFHAAKTKTHIKMNNLFSTIPYDWVSMNLTYLVPCLLKGECLHYILSIFCSHPPRLFYELGKCNGWQ